MGNTAATTTAVDIDLQAMPGAILADDILVIEYDGSKHTAVLPVSAATDDIESAVLALFSGGNVVGVTATSVL